MSTDASGLVKLHTALIDSKRGYEEALRLAEGKGLAPLFAEMIALRSADAAELAPSVIAAGETPDQSGSIMGTVHKAVINVRAAFSELDERILPGLIDGEQRISEMYEAELKQMPLDHPAHSILTRQRTALLEIIADMRNFSGAI